MAWDIADKQHTAESTLSATVRGRGAEGGSSTDSFIAQAGLPFVIQSLTHIFSGLKSRLHGCR